MVRVRYNGLSNATEAFGALKPLREAITRMQGRYRPFGPDYLILDAVKKALDTAAFHFTSDHEFFSMKPEPSKYGTPEG